MAPEKFEQLTAANYDEIRELDNIGMGGAATALSMIIGAPTDISIPDVKVIRNEEATRLMTLLSGGALCMLITVNGDVCGKIVNIIPSQFAERVIGTYYEKKISSWNDLNEMDLSVMFEMTNIISAQFCNSLSDQLGMMIDISTPTRCQNLAAETVSGTNLMLINTMLMAKETGEKEFVIFLPEEKSIGPILDKVKIKKK